jgi:TolB-like protein/Flp pilus assembly protein TadD
MANEITSFPQPDVSSRERLDSWKEIAAYLKCSERTVRRWEAEGLPVHRHTHKTKAGIYAYKDEIDAWWQQDHGRLEKAQVGNRDQVRFRSWRLAAFVSIAIGLVIAGLFARGRSLWLGSSVPVRTLAVLPLRNLSGDPSQDYFADGVTDALTTELARMETLQVISVTSAMQYKAANKPLPTIARELKADAIVEGSVERSGNQVRITAQLIRADTDKHLWAETYERNSSDILTLQDEVASAIAEQIETRLGGPKPSVPPKVATVSPEAYETYLQANYEFDNGELPKSIDYYNQAVKLDPNYAPTYAHMARAYFFLAFFGALSPQEGWGNVKQMATLALEKDESEPEAHGALALEKMHYEWDFAGAEREFKRGLELNPSDADIRHDYAHYLMAMGRVDESAAETKRAVELDPVGTTLSSCLCWHSFADRKYDDAVRLATNFLAAHPNNAWEHTILGWTYEQKRMPDQAIAEFQKAVGATHGRAFYAAALGHAYAMAGRKADAEHILQTLSQQANKGYVSTFDVATIYSGLGEKDKAFTWLDKAAAEHSTFLVYAKWEPRLDPLRSDPRFNQLLKRIGLAN